MRHRRKLLTGAVVLAAAVLIVGCNSDLDDEPDVILEVENLIVPPITGAIDSTTGTCAFTVTLASATFKNKPKNQFATESPFNDIIMQNVAVTYAWDDGFGAGAAPIQFGIGTTVPADGSSSAQFAVVTAQDVAGRETHTASLQLTFHGVTVSGDPVEVTTGGSLTVNTCQ